jgi:pyridoxal phosphate enzyme (YggS family)
MPSIDPAANYLAVRGSLPEGVQLVVAAKSRTPQQVRAVIDAGARIIGHNYVQEAEAQRAALGPAADRAQWHLIGHLQRNKINRALALFDTVQSVDSLRLARGLSKRAAAPLRVLVEVNVAGEQSKTGVPFDRAPELVRAVRGLPNLRLEGLMAMEPYLPDPEQARPYFRRMRQLRARLQDEPALAGCLGVLSMGMSHSYRVAVEEGANMVRVGTAIFGPRE